MTPRQWILAAAVVLVSSSMAWAQPRPYIGFVYPAGGERGTTFQVRLGGQGLDGVDGVSVSGKGVTARVVEYFRRMNPQDMQLLREQVNELKRGLPKNALAALKGTASNSGAAMMSSESEMMASPATEGKGAAGGGNEAAVKLISRIERRMAEYVQRPACVSLSSIALVEVTIASDAEAGQRELTVTTRRGVSNPLVFFVGQLPEVSRKPMYTSHFQVLGKEELALRKRPDDEIEQRVVLPCTLNGQIASGEVNRYRFEARKGQRLVISVQARQLVPYIADAVPGWFQPVLSLCDAKGKELAYDDDYRFKPDPVIFYEVPKDGEYLLNITDAIFRGREDFVYRITMGEMPFVTSIFPLGARVGQSAAVQMKGWNVDGAELTLPAPDASPGTYLVAGWNAGWISNRVPFAVGTLPECLEKEPNNDRAHAQKIKLPVTINGRINHPDDWDVFQFEGRAGDMIVAEVDARRLDSPLDSLLKVTDASGKLLALNDDHRDPESGANTHDADSYLMGKLPADGVYFAHVGDTARHGGDEYAYRLRISPPQPDFSLYVVPTSLGLRSKSSGAVSIYAVRKDGFSGPIKVSLKDPPEGFSASPLSLAPGQAIGRLVVKTSLSGTKQPVDLSIEGRSTIGGREVVRRAVPAEDRMQAFLWRHLVPAEELRVLVFDPADQPPTKRAKRLAATTAADKKAPVGPVDPVTGKPKFTKQQVLGRLRQLDLLFDEGLLTEAFHARKVEECEGGG